MRRKAALLCRKKPGYPLVSFLPAAKKDTAPIPCAGESLRLSPWEFCFAKLQEAILCSAVLILQELRTNSWILLGGVWGKAPNSENQNAARFGSPCAGESLRLSPWEFHFVKLQGIFPKRGRCGGGPTVLSLLLRTSGRGALCFAYIHVRLACAHKTMHRMVLSPAEGVVENAAGVWNEGEASPL
jgi:hypothetical protein